MVTLANVPKTEGLLAFKEAPAMMKMLLPLTSTDTAMSPVRAAARSSASSSSIILQANDMSSSLSVRMEVILEISMWNLK